MKIILKQYMTTISSTGLYSLLRQHNALQVKKRRLRMIVSMLLRCTK
jgi:NurA-like 5'-3' nuclease